MEKKILTEETIDRCLGWMAGEGTNSRTRKLTPQKRLKSIKNMRYLLGRRAGSDIRHLARPVCYGGAKFQALPRMIPIRCHESIVGILTNTKVCRDVISAFTLSHPALSFFELDTMPPTESICAVSAFCQNKGLKVVFVYMYPTQLVSA
jgi:hypothetical protein